MNKFYIIYIKISCKIQLKLNGYYNIIKIQIYHNKYELCSQYKNDFIQKKLYNFFVMFNRAGVKIATEIKQNEKNVHTGILLIRKRAMFAR